MANISWLRLNLVLLMWGTFQIWHTATWEVPEVMKNQSCCKGDYQSTGECCAGKVVVWEGEEQCYWHGKGSNKTAKDGVIDLLKVYQILICIIIIVTGLIPYHSSKLLEMRVFFEMGEEEENYKIKLPELFWIVSCFELFVLFIMFVISNIILGYSITVPCKNPNTSEFEILYEHRQYDFTLLVIAAWLVPGVIGVFITAVIFWIIITALRCYIKACLYVEEPAAPTWFADPVEPAEVEKISIV